MNFERIPKEYTIKRSTAFFTPETVQKALLSLHNTAPGVYGQICVMNGTLSYYGFANKDDSHPELTRTIEAGSFTTTPPQYWHRVELSEDAIFNINFWSEPK